MFWQAVAALTPMVCVALLFWYAMRAILNADRRERAALAEFEARDSKGTSSPGDSPSPQESGPVH